MKLNFSYIYGHVVFILSSLQPYKEPLISPYQTPLRGTHTVVPWPIRQSFVENLINIQFDTFVLISFILNKKFECFFAFQQHCKLLKFNIILGPFSFNFSIGTSTFLLQICWFKGHGIYSGFKIGCSRIPLFRNIIGTFS
jgi:hypothetical protein